MRQYLGVTLVILLAVALIAAGCTKKNSETSPETAKASPQNESAANAGEGKVFNKFEPPVTVTTNRILSENLITQYANVKEITMENNPYTKWARETMGIVFKDEWISPDDTTNSQKLNLAMAGKTLPDIIYGSGKDIGTLAKGGQLAPLNEVIEKYASPLSKYFIDQFQTETGGAFFAPFTYDGQIYAFPIMADIWANTWESNWIREDIVKSLGKELPRTLGEFEELLAGFKAQNPEGVGHTLYMSSKGITGMDTAMQPFEANPGKWVEDKDGKLVYGSVQPQVKEGLATLAKWYANGWIDPEFIVKDEAKSYEAYAAGNALNYFGMWWLVWNPFPDVLKNIADSKVTAIPPFLMPDGKEPIVTLKGAYSIGNSATAINANFKHPEVLIQHLNLYLDSVLRSDTALREKMKKEYDYDFYYDFEEIQLPLNPEAETGSYYQYNYKNEGPDYFNQTFGLPNIGLYHGTAYQLLDQYKRLDEAEKNGKLGEVTIIDQKEFAKYQEISPKRWDSLATSVRVFDELQQAGRLSSDKYVGSPTQTLVDKGAYLSKLEQEAFTKIIMGEKSVDDFDQFVKEWNTAGGADLTAEVNEWYAGLSHE